MAGDSLDMTPAEVSCLIADAGNIGVLNIVITGGEPLENFSAVARAIEDCAEQGIRCSLNSTLTVLTPPLAEQLVAAGPFDILVSIAGPDAKTHDAMMGRRGAFDETVNGVGIVRSLGIPFAANMVVTKRNVATVLDTGVLAAELGAYSFAATKATSAPWQRSGPKLSLTRDEVEWSLEQLEQVGRASGISVEVLECYPMCMHTDRSATQLAGRRGCSAGVTSVAVGPTGEMRACAHSTHTYGNALRDGIAAVFSLMSEWRDGSLLPTECAQCSALRVCSGGCRVEAECVGNSGGMDPLARGEAFAPSIASSLTEPAREFAPSDRFRLARGTRLRREARGFAVVGRGRVVLVDEDAGQLCELMRGQYVGMEQAMTQCGASAAEVAAVLSSLLAQGMVVIDGDAE